MKLHEYQSKTIFSKYGIPIPKGRVATTAQEAKQIAEELGGRVVVKSQVLVGGRGKAGGVKLAKDSVEAEQLATQILGMDIKGLPVRKVLVDEASAIAQEIYFAITDDRSAKKPVIIASAAGGIDIGHGFLRALRILFAQCCELASHRPNGGHGNIGQRRRRTQHRGKAQPDA